ncbi:hypothetical protein E3983_02125 [Legionella israelensis]|uniref:AMP-binding protein n=1 Tax=Legionella israelensis TaxID=454 RepID=A0AAX1EEK2_9GAMM|nr:AMP-binding protein [Legionella israelensis]QBR83259.1 hypothetical protein E3983_02125 [Legionella israelensis]
MIEDKPENSLSLVLWERLNQDSDFTVIDEEQFNKKQILEKVLAYCQWLDALDVRVVMLMSEPGIDCLCLIYALIISHRVYIPIHSSTPPLAIKKYLDMTQAELLLVQSALAKNWDTLHLCSNDSLGFDYVKISQNKTMNILPGMLLFTSGTTALPKVVHYHYDVIYKYLLWSIETFHFSTKDSYLFTTKLPFIASLRPLFLPFFSDMTLIIPKARVHSVFAEYREKIARYQCSILSITPGLFKKLLIEIKQQKDIEAYRCIRLIFLSGEAIDVGDINDWFYTINAEVQFFNLYGATEYLVPFYHHIKAPLTREEGLFLGKLRATSDFQLLRKTDNYFRLLVSGNLATAYLDPKLNTEFFLIKNNKRFFKSNDLVQYRKGKLYFCGRSQDLIKRYGHLIHLKQIEAFIQEHFPNHSCTVLFDDDREKINLFIEYPYENRALFIEKLKLLFKNFFPSYMHPDNYMLMKQLPQTDTGKINHQALKKHLDKESNPDFFSFFKKFFPNGNVDLNCRLVDLGMESIDYIEMGERIFQDTGKWLPSSLLNEECTIGQIPEKLCNPIIEDEPGEGKVKLNKVQEISFAKQIKGEKSHHQSRRYFISYFCLAENIDIPRLQFAIKEMIDNHFMLCCHLEEEDGNYYFVRSLKPANFELKHKWFTMSRIDKRLITSVHSERLVNFYIQKKGKRYYLIMAYHHIALDGWSALQLREELFLRYEDNEQVKSKQLSPAEEIYYLNRLHQLKFTKDVNIEELLALAQNIRKQEYSPLSHLFDSNLVDKNTFFILSKKKFNAFITHYQLNMLPNSSILLLVFYMVMSGFSSFKKLLIYSSMSNRYLPGIKLKELMTNIAFSLPVFIDGESTKNINELASIIKQKLDVNFRHMSYEALIKFWSNDIAHKYYVHRAELPYWLQYTYINYRTDEDCIQNKYIDWEKSSSFVALEEKGMIFFRVYDLKDRFIINIDSKMNKGLHSPIVNQFLELINVKM